MKILLIITFLMYLMACTSSESKQGGINRIQVKETVMISNKMFSIIEVDSIEYLINRESITPLVKPCN